VALWGHVGDSRLYLLRDQRASAVTRDDSVLQWMVDAGLWQADQLHQHPQRNQLMAALGADEGVEPHLSADPFELRDGDAFLRAATAGGQRQRRRNRALARRGRNARPVARRDDRLRDGTGRSAPGQFFGNRLLGRQQGAMRIWRPLRSQCVRRAAYAIAAGVLLASTGPIALAADPGPAARGT